jgi:DNA-binding MurR/RpiR family transcriptional regulator
MTRARDAVLELIEGQRLTPAQRRIAQCLVTHATKSAYLSSGDLAALAQVSQPSVTRFAMALGYDGYPALRDHLRVTIDASWHLGNADRSAGNQYQQALNAEIDNLRQLEADVADDAIPVAEAGRVLASSQPLPVLGLRAAGALAAAFAYFAAKIHPDVRLLQEGGSLLSDRFEQARDAGAGAMLAFVLPRYPREAVDALRAARVAGLQVVTVTDSPVSPAAAESDLVLTAAVGSRLVFDLHTAPMAMVTVLLQAMCDAAPADTQRRLETFERSAARRQVFMS